MAILDGWRHCPRCGGALAHVTGHADCTVCGFVVWANSSPAVQALVQQDGRLLLARRALDPQRGKWDLPGGFLEEGELPLEGLRRELREETGLEVEVGAFVGAPVDPYAGRFVLGLTWLATPIAGEARADDDVAELRWFAPEELPRPEEFAFPSQPGLVAFWRDEHAVRASLPATESRDELPTLQTFRGHGLQDGIDLDDSAALLESMERQEP